MPGILLRLRSPVVRTVFKCLVSRIRLTRERALAGVRGAPGEGIPAGEGTLPGEGALPGV